MYKPKLVVLLPTRNEELGIGEVISRIPNDEIAEMGYEMQIVVVDGNSKDKTCQIAKSMGATIIHQSKKIGKGIGVREALTEIFKETFQEQDILVMLDADATYDPEEIPRFIECLKKNDVVWGSRLRGNIEKGAMKFSSRVGNRLLSLSASLIFFKRTTDLCTGYWGFRINSLKKFNITATGFALEADLFSNAVKLKMLIKELKIDYKHREGLSTLYWYKDGPKIFSMLIKKRFTRQQKL